MPAYNSYILLSHVSQKFLNELDASIKTLIQPWWKQTPLLPHLTLGQLYGVVKDTPKTITEKNKELTSEVQVMLGQNTKNSTFLIPSDIEISDNGWILLTYSPVNVDDEKMTNTEATNLKNIHFKFEAIADKLEKKYDIRRDRFGNQFKPHISIGKVSPSNILNDHPSPFDVENARNMLKKCKSHFLQQLNQLRMLNLYNLELQYNDTQGKSVSLLNSMLSRRDFNIKAIKPNVNHVNITFDSKEAANRFSHFMHPLSIKTQQDVDNINISRKDYDFLVGIIKDCHAIKPVSIHSVIQANKKKIHPNNLFAPKINANSAKPSQVQIVSPMTAVNQTSLPGKRKGNGI